MAFSVGIIVGEENCQLLNSWYLLVRVPVANEKGPNGSWSIGIAEAVETNGAISGMWDRFVFDFKLKSLLALGVISDNQPARYSIL